LWDALTTKYGASDAGSDLYIMESFHDYKMADNRSIVEQAHEIQCIARSSTTLRLPYMTDLWLGVLLQSCLLHGGTLPHLCNIRDMGYQLKI
jgi:hypothetical protein